MGQVEVEGGIEWPELIDHLRREQNGQPKPWAIREKQTGGPRHPGRLARLEHPRPGTARPADHRRRGVVRLAGGRRRQGPDLQPAENPGIVFLAIGGYGLFCVIVQVRRPRPPYQGAPRGGGDR